GGSGGATGPAPSAGCGKMSGRPTSPMGTNPILTFPDAYDGSTPMPLVFGFNGAGRTNTQFRTADAKTSGTDLEKKFVMAYLGSTGNGWGLGTDRPKLDAAFDMIKNSYCIDTNRVFVTGHSSGAQMIAPLL